MMGRQSSDVSAFLLGYQQELIFKEYQTELPFKSTSISSQIKENQKRAAENILYSLSVSLWLLLSHTLHPNHRFPSVPSSSSPHLFPSPLHLLLLCFPSGNSEPPRNIKWTQHKQQNKAPYQGWMKKPSRKKRSQKQTKESETSPTRIVKSPTRSPDFKIITLA